MVYQGETIRIKGVFTDYDGTATNPTSHSIEIYDPDGTAGGTPDTSPTDSGTTGTFYSYWSIASDAEEGVWYIVWTVTIATRTGIFKVPFKVEAVR